MHYPKDNKNLNDESSMDFKTESIKKQKKLLKWIVPIVLLPYFIALISFLFLLGSADWNVKEATQIVKDFTHQEENSLVKKGIFNVTVTLPKDFIENDNNFSLDD